MSCFYKLRNKKTKLFLNKNNFKESKVGSTYKNLAGIRKMKDYAVEYLLSQGIISSEKELEIVKYLLIEDSVLD